MLVSNEVISEELSGLLQGSCVGAGWSQEPLAAAERARPIWQTRGLGEAADDPITCNPA